MAITLSVTYTPNYEGNHRICFKTTGTAYCCYNDDSTSIVGVPKTTVINLEDYELCLQTLPQPIGCAGSVVDGYVQPICIEQGSDINRVTFSVTYDSTQCTPYSISCNESGIGTIELLDGGSGYGPLEYPQVTITDSAGYGYNAIVIPEMTCVAPSGPCSVSGFYIQDPGYGYFDISTLSVTIDPPNLGGVAATAQVTYVDDCGTFTVPNCDGTANPAEYQLIGAYWINSINVCSSGNGPDAPKYTVIPNPTYGAEGPELVVNGSFTNDLSGWTPVPYSDPTVFWTAQGVEWTNSDEGYGLSQDILTPGQNYIIDITLTCAYGPSFPQPVPTDQVAFLLYFGTYMLSPIYFDGTNQSYQFNYIPCIGNGVFQLLSYNTLSPSQEDVVRICSYVSIRQMDVQYPVSCCDCVKYDIYNNRLSGDAIEFHYTDCTDQTVKTMSIEPGGYPTSISLCTVRGSIWPSDKLDNSQFQVVESATQDC